MDYNTTLVMADRLESLARRAFTFNKSREDIVEEIGWIAKDLRKLADQYDRDMNKMYEETV